MKKKKEMIPSTSEEKKLYRKQKVCYNCKKDLVQMMIIKNIKSEIIVISLESIEELLVG